jgi:phosphoribosylamine--glycine ligase
VSEGRQVTLRNQTVLILGSGGREHALAWRLSTDHEVGKVFVAPGNPGMEKDSKVVCVPSFMAGDEGNNPDESLLQFVRDQGVDLVVIGPEKFLFEGVTDALRIAGVPVLGPDRAAAFLEGSKREAKKFMRASGIRTSEFETGHTLEEAREALEKHTDWRGYVVKLSGPALGKGVWVCRDRAGALRQIHEIYEHRPQGHEDGWVIEEALGGPEVSMFFLCDGKKTKFLASARDHKRLCDFDRGPNTGGMGAVSPAPGVTPEFIEEVQGDFAEATLRGMQARGTPFSGVLFLGLMFDAPVDGARAKPHLLEYNVRFGDPETQAFLPLIRGSFYQLLRAAAMGALADLPSAASDPGVSGSNVSVHVVKASFGYPGNFGRPIASGEPIRIEENTDPNARIFFAGVGRDSSSGLLTRGGRVLGITATGPDLASAQAVAYANLGRAGFASEIYRSDIGGRNAATRKIRVALFASGSGTNAKALLEEAKQLRKLEIPLLIIDRGDSPLLREIPPLHSGVRVAHVPVNPDLRGEDRRSEHEQRIESLLGELRIDWIFLAGYMRILSPAFVREKSIVNIHPSLLPKYPGLHAYEQAWSAGERLFGITVHHVDQGVDTGSVIEQVGFERRDGEDLPELIERGKRLEWDVYRRVLRKLDAKGRL